MRLDHLLSTEFFRTPVWRPSCGPCAGDGSRVRVGVLVWKRSLASRVLGAGGERYGYAFGFPDRHPHPFWVRAVFRMPLAGRRRPCGPRVGSGRGAWWFENWIVDASNAGFFVLLALSRFRQASFLESGFEIDRFVIIFYSVMICRLAFEAIIGFFRGVCRPEGRMVDALADSTDEGRLRMR